jgi:hypothetical protein
MGTESLTEELNKSKELFIQTMHQNGIITDQQFETMQEHSIVIAQKGFFGSLWDKIFKKDDSAYYFVVKILSPKNPELAVKPETEDDETE